MSSLVYTHPETHPASMITGLEDVLSNLGYRHVTTFSGTLKNDDGDLSFQFPFKPSFMIARVAYAILVGSSTLYSNIDLISESNIHSYYLPATLDSSGLLTFIDNDLISYASYDNKTWVFYLFS